AVHTMQRRASQVGRVSGMFTPLSASVLGPIENVMRHMLQIIHDSGLSWAWSIIALTAIVRLVIFPLTSRQTRSSLSMQRLQPYLKQLQQKHKDDRAALNTATMEFYRDNKVNPLASCFPLLIQVPVFFALYRVLRNFSATSKGGNFSFLFGFVHDIRQQINNHSSLVPHNWFLAGWILLLFYVASQMLSTVTMMTSPNPQQKWMFMLMPLLFVPVVLKFPIGVMLYWITTNLWSLGQYLFVVRFTNADKEIVLPADSKGNKKTVVPKGEKRALAAKGDKSPTVGQDRGQSSQARRNKRRR
ncbi:MAG: YidC/Oxa1 family membrane protein insertase, partial [Gaiellales bacterium]